MSSGQKRERGRRCYSSGSYASQGEGSWPELKGVILKIAQLVCKAGDQYELKLKDSSNAEKRASIQAGHQFHEFYKSEVNRLHSEAAQGRACGKGAEKEGGPEGHQESTAAVKSKAKPPKKGRTVPALPRPEALAPAQSKASFGARLASVEEIADRPLICLDWHRIVSFDDNRSGESCYVPPANVVTLIRCQEAGFDVAITSFSSARTTQEKTLTAARQLEQRLKRPFKFIAICPRKTLADPEKPPSIIGHT
eukprot:s2775_g5.t1